MKDTDLLITEKRVDGKDMLVECNYSKASSYDQAKVHPLTKAKAKEEYSIV